jgi:hypothetical protein
VEQILRGALYKKMKNLTYRELEYAQHDSRICDPERIFIVEAKALEGEKDPREKIYVNNCRTDF